MRLLVVHLSDLHIGGTSDPVLTRAKRVAEAVQNLERELDAAVITVTGDLAFAGHSEQYYAAWQFLEDVAKHLRVGLSPRERGSAVPVYIIAVPGNHDCDFTGVRPMRGVAVQAGRNDHKLSEDVDVVITCTEVQSTFFEYLDTFGAKGSSDASPKHHHRLAYKYEIPIGNGIAQFLCLNTAWLSERQEQQGQLYFPANAVQPDGKADVVMAMFHHPYNWIESEAGRSFRKQLEATANLILTGHEHDALTRTQQMSSGERNTYIEGGALQIPGKPNDSTFNAIVLDLVNRKQKLARCEWNGDRYLVKGPVEPSGDVFGLVWEDFQVTRLRTGDRFEFSETTVSWLDDLGMTLFRQSHGPLRLSDVFVFPDLQEVLYPRGKNGQSIPGARIIDLVADAPQLILLGDSKSGKTALAKVLFQSLHRSGYVPVILSGNETLPHGEHLYSRIVRAFSQQYRPDTIETYKQLDRHRRAIIVDDFDRLRLSPKDRRRLAENLQAFAGRVILIANFMNFELMDLLHPEGLAEFVTPFTVYKIRPFGHRRRGDLVDKWIALGDGSSVEPAVAGREHAQLMNTMDVFIGNNFLPPHPFAILMVLQAYEAGTPAATNMSTYGAYYELLIRMAMARGRTPSEWDTDLNYLAHFAYQMFQAKRTEVDEAMFHQINMEFEKRFEVSKDAKYLRRDLLQRDILSVSGETTRFRYPYIYYYFVAYWMRDHMSEASVRNDVIRLSRSLHVDECANIVLFLAHLCKDPFIIGELIAAADSSFPDSEPAAFADDLAFLLNIGAPLRRVRYRERDVIQSRNHVLATLDEAEELNEKEKEEEEDTPHLDAPDGPSTDALSLINKFNAAMKTVDILGQVLKNFPGSLDGDLKLEIAQKCFTSGLRTAGGVFATIRDTQDGAISVLKDIIKERCPELAPTDAEAEAIARGFLHFVAELLGYAVVVRIAYAIGSPELTRTYVRMVEKNNMPSVRLIDVALKLDHSPSFPEGTVSDLAREFREGSFARMILQDLVLSHFYLFPVNFRVKQKICAVLGIQYSPTLSLSPLLRLPGQNGSA